MLHRVYANKKQFRPVEFKQGLNIILADRKDSAGKKDSRNGLGKTSFIYIVNFCLGADLNRKIIPVTKLNKWIFYLEMDLGNSRVTISRSISSPSEIQIQGDFEGLQIAPDYNEKNDYFFFSIEKWRKLLGYHLFDLPKDSGKNYPTFRSLIPFFLRSGAEAFISPFTYLPKKSAVQQQVEGAFLLGLNWHHPISVATIKDKNNVINALKKALDNEMISSKGQLEAERVTLSNEYRALNDSLTNFKVLPNYRELQEQANSITEKIKNRSNESVIKGKKIKQYEESLQLGEDESKYQLDDMYSELGVHFSDSVKKTLEEAKIFHSSLEKNRKLFLQSEITELKFKIEKIDNEVANLVNQRNSILSTLNTHGALDDFARQQDKLLQVGQKLKAIEHRLEEISNMAQTKKDLKLDRNLLDSKIARDFEEARTRWEKAVTYFSENTKALYNEPGKLILNFTENGKITDNAYKFEIEMPKSKSEGVGKMKIYSYDLMLVHLFCEESLIDFLIHDSGVYDAVDSRQRAHALEYANKKGLESGFQYICALNSDMLPINDFSKNFKVSDHVKLTLSDASPEETLFGFIF